MAEASPTAGQSPVWRFNPLVDLHWRIWGSSCAVFEAVSGETAVVDALEAATLACFDERPHNLQQLVQTLAADLRVDPRNGLTDRVHGIVQECLARGWLEPLKSGE